MAWSTPRTWTTGETVTAAHMNQEVRDNLNAVLPNEVAGVSYTPTLEATTTDATATVTGREYRVGILQFVAVRFVLTTVGSGTYFVTLPRAASGLSVSTSAGKGQAIGGFHARDDTPPHMLQGSVVLGSTTTVRFHASSIEASGGGVLSHDNPRTWAADDVFSFFAVYPTA